MRINDGGEHMSAYHHEHTSWAPITMGACHEPTGAFQKAMGACNEPVSAYRKRLRQHDLQLGGWQRACPELRPEALQVCGLHGLLCRKARGAVSGKYMKAVLS